MLRNLFHILSPQHRRRGVIQLGLMLVGMLFETLSVGLLIPILAVISQADITVRYPFLKPFFTKLGNPTQTQILIGVMIILLIIYIIKMLFLAMLAWRQAKFIYGLQTYFSHVLFKGYLLQPYTFHLSRNSAQLIRNVIQVVASLTTSLTAVLTILTEIITLAGIIILLLAIEPIGTLIIVAVLGAAAVTFQSVIKKRLVFWGAAFQEHEGLRMQHLQQGLGGVKDVKLLGRESDFLEQYKAHNLGSAGMGQRQLMLQALPRLWLEVLAVAGMVFLIIYMVMTGNSVSEVLPVLGLFAAAAFRLIPSANRILGSIQTARFAEPAIKSLSEEIELIRNQKQHPRTALMPFNREITLENVGFKYPNAHRSALKEVKLTIHRGTSVGFIGTTGSGKSTLVDVLLGLLAPGEGHVKVDGADIQTNLRGWQDQIGYVPQTIFLTDDSLRRNIAFGLSDNEINDSAIMRAVKAAQLEAFINELPEGLNTKVGERGVRLSGGQRQRIGIARALYHDPDVLVLDEATSSLDTDTERDVMTAVEALQGQKTIIIVAHRLSTIEHCDYLFRLDKGRLVEEGKAIEILNKSSEA